MVEQVKLLLLQKGCVQRAVRLVLGHACVQVLVHELMA